MIFSHPRKTCCSVKGGQLIDVCRDTHAAMQRDVAMPLKIRRADAPLTSMDPRSEQFVRGETKLEAHRELQLPCLHQLPMLRNPSQSIPNRPGVLGWGRE